MKNALTTSVYLAIEESSFDFIFEISIISEWSAETSQFIWCIKLSNIVKSLSLVSD